MSKEASFDLQQPHPHYAAAAPLSAAGGRNRRKGVHGKAWGHERGEGQTERKAGNCNSNFSDVINQAIL